MQIECVSSILLQLTRNSLLLPARKLRALVSYLRIVAIGKAHDEVIGIRHYCSLADFIHGSSWLAISDISSDGCGKERRLLAYIPNDRPQVVH